MAAGDVHTARYNENTQGFERIGRCVDNTIFWDDNREGNFKRTCDYAANNNQESMQKKTPGQNTTDNVLVVVYFD